MLSKTDGTYEGEFEITCIPPTIHRIVRMLSANAQNKDVEIITNIRDESMILIQEDDLYQIIFNLVENGIKYNMPGGRLTVKLLRQEDNALLQVTDTGVGIPEESLSHVFERFYRVDKMRSRAEGGTGLGLSIVKDTVEYRGGTITVADRGEQAGTVFTVRLPLSKGGGAE